MVGEGGWGFEVEASFGCEAVRVRAKESEEPLVACEAKGVWWVDKGNVYLFLEFGKECKGVSLHEGGFVL